MQIHFFLPSQHRAGLRPYTLFYNLAESCVFIKQSPPSIFCNLKKLILRPLFFQSYEENLPSSFNILNLFVLVDFYQLTCVGL